VAGADHGCERFPRVEVGLQLHPDRFTGCDQVVEDSVATSSWEIAAIAQLSHTAPSALSLKPRGTGLVGQP